MIFAETERLHLRPLAHSELPRLVELLGEWEVVRWLSVVPFPYTMKDADAFYADTAPHNAGNAPQFYALALKSDNLLIGGIGLHPPRGKNAPPGQVEIGYWLGRDFWGKGYMTEAAPAVAAQAFARPDTYALGATTDPKNVASQKILRKLGMEQRGIVTRPYPTLRGGDQMIAWHLSREDYAQRLAA